MSEHQSHIFPFLWLKGEEISRVKEEINGIKESNIDEFVIESRTHPEFLKEGWWEDFYQILEYAKALDMRVWLLDDAHFPTGYANGAVKQRLDLKKEYLYYSSADVYSEAYELTLNINLMRKPKRKWSDRKKPESYERAIEKNEIQAIVAYPLLYDNILSESYIDLTTFKDLEFLNYTFPKGNWRVFVLYQTTENAGDSDYINMLSKDSVNLLVDTVYETHYQKFSSYFGNVFRGFFSDEPGFGNILDFSKDNKIGKDMALPWSAEVAEYLKEDLPFLALLWNETKEKNKQKSIRLKYMTLITDLYRKNFSQNIGDWCKKRNVDYIGHVIEDNNMHSRLGRGAGHYFKAMKGQSMAGIDIISSQITIAGDESFRTNSSQNDGTFYQYCLPKLADSCAQLDPEKSRQAFCELYGAYGWQLSIRNMKWILDSLLVRGIYNFVPHAFSMSEFPDLDSPPHFYANGCNPQFPLFKTLMQEMGAASNLLSGGKLDVKLAILYDAELEWLAESMKMQVPSKVLSQHQIDFLYLTIEDLDKAIIKENTFQIHQQTFEKLIIPQTDTLPKRVYDFIQKLDEEVFIFINQVPLFYVDDEQTKLTNFKEHNSYSLDELVLQTESYKNIKQLDKGNAKLAVRRQIKNGEDWMMVHNESLNDSYQFSFLKLKKYCYEYDLKEDKYYHVSRNLQKISPYQAKFYLLTDEKRKAVKKVSANFKDLHFENNWLMSLYNSQGALIYQKEINKFENLSHNFVDFSGKISYSNSFLLTDKDPCHLFISRVFDGCQIKINGKQISSLIAPPYSTSFSENLKLGENKIEINVFTTADRQLAREKLLINQFEVMEAIGIIGEVILTQESKE
ncbi:MAG: hypothetical protein ACK5LM_06595 [Lactovum sp.]